MEVDRSHFEALSRCSRVQFEVLFQGRPASRFLRGTFQAVLEVFRGIMFQVIPGGACEGIQGIPGGACEGSLRTNARTIEDQCKNHVDFQEDQCKDQCKDH